MSKLNELIKELCPDGVPKMKLGAIGKVSMCKRILKADTATTGDVPFYKIGTFGKDADAFISYEKYEEFSSKYSYPKKGDILISAAGTIGRTVIYDGSPAYYQDSNIVWLAHDESIVLNKYLYYCYELQPWMVSSGGTISRLYNDNIMQAEIYVPPLPVQCEIVRILDNFTALTSALTAELTAQRKRYSGFLNSLLSFEGRGAQDGVLWKKLGDIAVNLDSRRIAVTKHNRKAGIYPYYGASGIVDYVDDYIFDGDFLLVSEDGANLVARSTPIAFSITGKNWVNNHAHVLKFDNIYLQKYVEIYLNLLDLSPYISKGAQPKLSQTSLKKIILPIPDDSRIRYVVDILDRFDKLCNDLSEGLPAEIAARQKQYEYYRDKLLTFKEKEA